MRDVLLGLLNDVFHLAVGAGCGAAYMYTKMKRRERPHA